MAKSGFEPMKNPDSWLSSLSFEDLTKLNKLVTTKIEQNKTDVKKKLLAQFMGQLSSLDLTLDDLGLGQGGKSGAGNRKRAPHAGPCPVCKFATEPSHDGRKHRSQGDNKKPFTKAELDELSLTRV